MRQSYKVPEGINADLENWARWSKQDGSLPHPLPSNQAPFARYALTDKTTAWESRTDDDGSIITVDLDDNVAEVFIDVKSAKRVQSLFNETTGWTRRVWMAEYIGFGEYSFAKHTIRRDLAAQKIGLSDHYYEQELKNITELLKDKF